MIIKFKIFENNNKKYYNSHGYFMTIKDLYNIEVIERENYSDEYFKSIMNNYNLNFDDNCIWVTDNIKNVISYILPASYYNEIMSSETYDELNNIVKKDTGSDISNLNIFEYTEKDGIIIKEFDDGDNGYLLVLKK